ncbi:MAG: hypothetical protein Q8939_12985, partial [Bacteroidota bacterium]|nr:hypothetical protein [Bacteroidota bacterium]
MDDCHSGQQNSLGYAAMPKDSSKWDVMPYNGQPVVRQWVRSEKGSKSPFHDPVRPFSAVGGDHLDVI